MCCMCLPHLKNLILLQFSLYGACRARVQGGKEYRNAAYSHDEYDGMGLD